MNMKFLVTLGYKDIFTDFEEVNISDLIEDIPTENSLEILSYFLAQIHKLQRDQSAQIEFIQVWAGRLPQEVREEIGKFISDLDRGRNSDYNFINYVSGLKLIEYLLENANTLPLVDNLTPLQELNLFKAYLYCSQQWIDKQLPGFEMPALKEVEDLIKMLVPTQLPLDELVSFKDFRPQFIKAIYFFKFCETHDEFKEYLNLFLHEYGLPSWQKYLVNLINFYIRKFDRLTTPSVLTVPDEFPDVMSFLDDLSIDPSTYEKSDDFLGIREKPLYRANKNDFVFLNLNFFVDKIYQGIHFAKVLVKHEATYKGNKIKNIPDFFSIFGNEFSEAGLFYIVMEHLFEKSNYIKYRGEKIKEFIGDGEPDYYIRDKGKVYVFEFKNIYLSAKVKHSGNYEEIKKEIFKKLVSNQDNSAKGVTQLVNTIHKIRKGEFKDFDDFDYANCIIYPVIVYVDHSFDLVGINFLLNKEFRRLLNEREGLDGKNINDLILLDIDMLIKLQDLFRNKTLKLNNCFNEFYESLINPDFFKKIFTFNMFITDKLRRVKYETPKMLFDEVIRLIEEDKEEKKTTLIK